MTIGAIYSGCLILGLSYAVLMGLAGWFFDHGDGDVQVDASGHLDAGHPSPLSGTTIATFITGFGAGGTLAHHVMEWTLVPGMLLASGSGVALAAAAYGVLDFIFSRTQAGSEYATSDVVGLDAEVITPIREGGMGEIAYVVKGQRERSSARARDGGAIGRGTPVTIDSVVGATAYVRHKDDS
jgi:hypothetical protein